MASIKLEELDSVFCDKQTHEYNEDIHRSDMITGETDSSNNIDINTENIVIKTEYTDDRIKQPQFLTVYLNEDGKSLDVVDPTQTDNIRQMQMISSCSNQQTHQNTVTNEAITDISTVLNNIKVEKTYEESFINERSWEKDTLNAVDNKMENNNIKEENLDVKIEETNMSTTHLLEDGMQTMSLIQGYMGSFYNIIPVVNCNKRRRPQLTDSEKLERKRMFARERQRRKRSKESVEKKAERLRRDRERHEQIRVQRNETIQQRKAHLMRNRIKSRKRRENETPQQREKRLLQDRLKHYIVRKLKTEEQLQDEQSRYLITHKKQQLIETYKHQIYHITRRRETEEKRQNRQMKDRIAHREKRLNETPEQREKRLLQDRQTKHISRQLKKKTLEQCEITYKNVDQNKTTKH